MGIWVPSPPMRFADCELDVAAFELRRNGEICPVEPQVFELLAFLLRNPGRLITKDELIAEVWGGRIVSDAALASRIKSARRAIGDDGERQRFIRTVHGRGFRFVSDAEPGNAAEPEARPLGAPLRQKIRFCTASDGVRLGYATVGSGPPLVKAANWLNHLEFDWESPVWSHLLRELARDNTLVRYDERGNGLSDREPADLSFDSFVRDLETVVDASGLERFPLFGVSQGCAVSVAYAVKHPDRVSHLILYGGYACGRKLWGDPEEAARREAMDSLILHGWGQDNPAFRQVFTSRFIPDATLEQMRWFNELQRISTSPQMAYRLRQALAVIDVRDQLSRVRAPTLVLHCRDDAAVPFERGREIAVGIPGARFVPLEGRNHLILENEPAFPRFLTEVRSFLAAPQGQFVIS